MKFFRSIAALAVASVAGIGSANAAALWEFKEVGSDLVGTLSGSLDVSGISPIGSGPSYGAYILLSSSLVQINAGGPAIGSDQPIYAVTGPVFGAGSAFSGTSSGDEVELVGTSLYLPVGYSGGPLATVLTFSGNSFSDLGVTPGDSIFTLTRPGGGGDTLTVRFSSTVSTVPLPAGLPLLLCGLGAIWLGGRRRS